MEVRIGGEARWIAVEDVARYRDALGVQPPRGVPDIFLAPTVDALDTLLLRWARTHAPFTARDPATRWGLPAALVQDSLRRLEAAGSILGGEFRPGGAEREFCDADVLRSLRRRSLARLRREVEPVPGVALARFLPAWHGVGSEAGTPDRLLDVVAQLEGVFLPWSIYERDVLPSRVRGYQPRLLDELCASGELVWLGRGSVGTDDGRVALFRRERLPLLAPIAPEEPPGEPIHDRIRHHLAERGASFFREIFSAVGGPTDAAVLDALWDLVWSGEITNDTLTPLRLRLQRRARTRRPMHVTRTGPPEAAGRWSLVTTTAPATERAHALALTVLERHGVVTRESVLGEGVPGGFASVYPVLRAMEEAGKIRRGYFVEGLGAAQFAMPGAVDRLRAERTPADGTTVHVLAAADPANPYGATLAWPKARRLQRIGGAYVILVDGEPALYLERGRKGLITLPAFEGSTPHALGALRRIAESTSRRELALDHIDGEPSLTSPLRPQLEQFGFAREYLSLTLRLPALSHPQARSA
jgi:ATP-dependent Lhr-like helicase